MVSGGAAATGHAGIDAAPYFLTDAFNPGWPLIQVNDVRTGTVTATIKPPAGQVVSPFIEAAGDDRTFKALTPGRRPGPGRCRSRNARAPAAGRGSVHTVRSSPGVTPAK